MSTESLPTIMKVVGLLGVFCGSLAFIVGSSAEHPSIWVIVAMIGGGSLYIGQAYLFPSPLRKRR